ncbi:hypothetical protein ACROYT_G007272 [Oculina patagonica]
MTSGRLRILRVWTGSSRLVNSAAAAAKDGGSKWLILPKRNFPSGQSKPEKKFPQCTTDLRMSCDVILCLRDASSVMKKDGICCKC